MYCVAAASMRRPLRWGKKSVSFFFCQKSLFSKDGGQEVSVFVGFGFVTCPPRLPLLMKTQSVTVTRNQESQYQTFVVQRIGWLVVPEIIVTSKTVSTFKVKWEMWLLSPNILLSKCVFRNVPTYKPIFLFCGEIEL